MTLSMHPATAHNTQSISSWKRAWSRIRISQFWLVAIALLLRVGWIIVGHTYKFKPNENNFGFGWEMGRIGAAIANGRCFSDRASSR